MRYSEVEDDKQEPGPDRNTVNQMIIYLDYGSRCDLGIVLFAEDTIRNDVLIKQKESGKVVFLNCYPFHQTCIFAFEKIKHYLCVE
jgi:hypothetical protein